MWRKTLAFSFFRSYCQLHFHLCISLPALTLPPWFKEKTLLLNLLCQQLLGTPSFESFNISTHLGKKLYQIHSMKVYREENLFLYLLRIMFMNDFKGTAVQPAFRVSLAYHDELYCLRQVANIWKQYLYLRGFKTSVLLGESIYNIHNMKDKFGKNLIRVYVGSSCKLPFPSLHLMAFTQLSFQSKARKHLLNSACKVP